MGIQQIQGGQQIEFKAKGIAISVSGRTRQPRVYSVESVNGRPESGGISESAGNPTHEQQAVTSTE
jgi:hypothetical protein